MNEKIKKLYDALTEHWDNNISNAYFCLTHGIYIWLIKYRNSKTEAIFEDNRVIGEHYDNEQCAVLDSKKNIKSVIMTLEYLLMNDEQG